MKKWRIYRVARPLLIFFINLYKPKAINIKAIPSSGKVLLAGNHISNLDPILVASKTKRVVHFLAKKELMKGIMQPIFAGLGIIPVDRQKKNPESVLKAIDYLNNNEVVAIFPEGTISKTDSLLSFKHGAVKIAYQADSPIIPFAIVKKYKFLKKSVKIIYGSPYKIMDDNYEKNTKELKNKIQALIEEGKKL